MERGKDSKGSYVGVPFLAKVLYLENETCGETRGSIHVLP